MLNYKNRYVVDVPVVIAPLVTFIYAGVIRNFDSLK